MKRQKVKKMLRSAFRDECGDLLSEIKADCTAVVCEEKPITEPPIERRALLYSAVLRHAIAAMICLFVFAGGVAAGLFIPRNEKGDDATAARQASSIYIDVNPSIELKLDECGRLLQAVALNSDAATVLSDLELNGVDVNTAVVAIIGSMYMNGYLGTGSDSILVSVSGADEASESEMLCSVTEKINSAVSKSSHECTVIGQTLKVGEELAALANLYGVSVGKINIALQAIMECDDLNEDSIKELAELPIKDLHLLYSDNKKNEMPENGSITGKGEGVKSREEAYSGLIEALDISGEAIERFEIKTVTASIEGKLRTAYRIKLQLKNDRTEYIYFLDFESGAIIDQMTNTSADKRPGDKDNDKINPDADKEGEGPQGQEDDRHKGDNGQGKYPQGRP